jgi:Fe-S cluster assembly iron-binding protein IscA
MLTITSNAAEAIRAIVQSTDVPDEGGIRISIARQNGSQASLELALSPAPMEGDDVLELKGAHVFLDEMASVALDDKALDAEVQGGEISFGIVEPDEEGPEPPV